MLINADRSQFAIVHGAQVTWTASPQQGVERRMLERIGDEVALATSIVRYAPQSRFPAHVHELGEEFLVLEGTFSDEYGAYPAGTYVRNPPGSSHAAFSESGCVILVKLRQMSDAEPQTVREFAHSRVWFNDAAGVERAPLYQNVQQSVELIRLQPGATIARRTRQHGEELFVVDGRIAWLSDPPTLLEKWSWLRNPGNEHCAIACQQPSLLWF